MDHGEAINNFTESLFRNNELHQILFENAENAIFITDESKIIDCNIAAYSLFGFASKAGLLGRFLFEFSPYFQPDADNSNQKASNFIREAINGKSLKFDWSFQKPDGIHFTSEVNLNSFKLDNKTYLYCSVVLQNSQVVSEYEFKKSDASLISELRQREKELIESESKYKNIFENIQDIFYQIDLNGIITEISPSFARYSSYSNEEVVGSSIEKFYYNPEDRQLLMSELEKKGELFDYELLLRGKDDQKLWTSLNAHFIYDKNQKIIGIEGVIRNISDRKIAEEKMKLSLSALQATLDSTTDGILVVNNSGKIINYNKQFKSIFNIPEDILVAGDDAAAIDAVLKLFKHPDLFISKIIFLYDHPEQDSFDTLEFTDGRIIERYSCPQLFDELPVGRVWSFRDVTERKHAEEQLHLMAHTLKSINECISITDTSDRILFVNEAFQKIYGYSAEELNGKNISMVRSPENNQDEVNKILDFTNDSGWKGELLNRRKDGSDFPISLSTTVIKNDFGETIGMVGVANDITAQKQAEERLKLSEKKYRDLIETMPDGVYRSTPEGKFVEVNPAMVKILGYDSKEELMAIDFKSQLYFNPEDRESPALHINQRELDVFPLKKKDGTAVFIEDHGWYVKDKDGKVIFHEGISRDVTDRKLAEIQLQKYSEELKELNATKDKFFSIIAHDLKSPFNSMAGLSEMIRNEAKHMDVGTIEQYAGIIHSTSEKTYRLLENLLDWARLQQDGMPFKPATILLKRMANEVADQLFENASAKKIALTNSIPDNLIVTADENMLKTILRNLVSNALKFTSANGKVDIDAVSGINEVEISVKDTGTGIKKEEISKIFKIDSNISRLGTENEKGTGLGLILCKEFVEKHAGKIWVESDEGKGSVFKFTLNQQIR